MRVKTNRSKKKQPSLAVAGQKRMSTKSSSRSVLPTDLDFSTVESTVDMSQSSGVSNPSQTISCSPPNLSRTPVKDINDGDDGEQDGEFQLTSDSFEVGLDGPHLYREVVEAPSRKYVVYTVEYPPLESDSQLQE